ncbi:MAG: hypothetical protein WC637_20040, partial [Victivallales bacterium]
MDLKESKELILEKLAYLKDKLPLKRIFFPCIGPSTPPRAINIPMLRINTVLSGSKLITLPLKSGVSAIQAKAGDMQCSIPNSWELQSWNTDHEFLCLVAKPDYLRIAYYMVKNGSVSGASHHTDRPYSESLRSAFQSMIALSREDD